MKESMNADEEIAAVPTTQKSATPIPKNNRMGFGSILGGK